MKAATRCKVSYVVKSANDEQAHCLGVNSLAIDTSENNTLYSAGRDGVVASWDLSVPNTNKSVDQSSKNKTNCKAFSQTHTNWVNDIVVCDKGTCVVSASSDRTIKVWSPYKDPSKQAHTIGTHMDYAKCLTYASHPGWVASGGLDKKIKVWNISQCQEIISIETGPSNYGESTENTLRKSTSKGSIYALATNAPGTLLASGSPEKLIRLWDPRSGKSIGKLTGHTDNIRALLMSEDGQHVLSGSSDSTIKMWSVGARRCLATYETHSDSVWALYSNHPNLKTFYSGSRDGLVNKTEITGRTVSEGECVSLLKENTGVIKIAVLDDKYIWTATSSSSINQWLSIPSINERIVLPRSNFNSEVPAKSITHLVPANNTYSHVRNSYISNDQGTLYAGSTLSIPASIHENEMNDQDNLVPLRSAPESTIQGKAGIMCHLMLQNRRQILTKDSNGEVVLWDLIKCVQIKSFGIMDLEQVAQKVNSFESSPAWCTVDTKIGAITVKLHESSCFDCEIYTDETNLPDDYETTTDQKLNLGKWILTYLFKEYVQKEIVIQKNGETRYKEKNSEKVKSQESEDLPQQELDQTPSAPLVPQTEEPKLPLAAVTSQSDQSPYSPQFTGPFTAPPSSNPQSDYFSSSHRERRESAIQLPPAAALSTSPTGTSFMNRFKSISVNSKTSRSDFEENPMSPALIGTPLTVKTSFQFKNKKEPELKDIYTPASLNEFPPLEIPQSTMIIIAEESAEASTGMDLYRGSVGSTGNDADVIVKAAPSWLLSYLLYDKTPTKAAVKFTFILQPAEGSNLEELPEGPNNRLMANRMLRVGKLIQYVADKIGKDASTIELLCGDNLLATTMTLAAIRQHILKTGGDIPLSYRLR